MVNGGLIETWVLKLESTYAGGGVAWRKEGDTATSEDNILPTLLGLAWWHTPKQPLIPRLGQGHCRGLNGLCPAPTAFVCHMDHHQDHPIQSSPGTLLFCCLVSWAQDSSGNP